MQSVRAHFPPSGRWEVSDRRCTAGELSPPPTMSRHALRQYFRLGTLLTLTFLLARAAEAQSDARGRVAGTVIDSVHNRPLAGVRVLAVGAGARTDVRGNAISDSAGLYHIDSLPPGQYMVGFESPLLDSLEIVLPPRRANVEQGEVAMVDLAMPPVAKIRAAVCPGTTLTENTGAIFGHVVNAETESSLAGVTIAMAWREISVDPVSLRSTAHERTTSVSTNDGGWYLACGVPTGTWLSMELEHEGRVGSPIRMMIGDTLGVAIRHLSFSSNASWPVSDSASTDSSTAASAPLSGSAMLSGVVRGTGGAPVTGAEVRVWGTAAVGRTDESGRYSLSALPAGTQMLEVRRIGFAVAERSVELRDGATATSDMQLQRIVNLDSVRVVAMRTRYPEFEKLRAGGALGLFLGPDEVARQNVGLTSTIIEKIPGFRVLGYGYNAVVTAGMGASAGGVCRTNIVIDGMEKQSINDVHPNDIGVIAVYRGGTMTPVWITDGSCGAILIWTKH